MSVRGVVLYSRVKHLMSIPVSACDYSKDCCAYNRLRPYVMAISCLLCFDEVHEVMEIIHNFSMLSGDAENSCINITLIYTVSQKKLPTFKLSVTLSNLNRFSKCLHCWKLYEICYKTHMTSPTSP